jgi:hypothetical protein
MAVFLSIAQWGVLVIVFAWLARCAKFRYLLPVAAGAIFIVVVLMQLVFALFGASVELDGP